MLKKLIIFALYIVAITANGELTILSSPKSLSFKGNEPIQSKYIGDVFYAAMGNGVDGDVQWSGMTINDPFNMPKQVISMALNGVANSKVSGAGKTYEVEGKSVAYALNGVSSQLEADNEHVCVINFEDFEDAVASFANIAGDVKIDPIANTKHLNSELHSCDKQYLQSIARMRAFGENSGSWKRTCSFVDIRLSVDSIAKAHGEKSEAMTEAIDLFTNVCKVFSLAGQKSSNSDVLIVAIVNKVDNSRSKRELLEPDAKNPYNLAEYYSEDYPVIFNIILWFMVTFAFALLAICYAIGSMDPGRDSIIYRMTSTRMKKDN